MAVRRTHRAEGYTPGDPLVTCDITGVVVARSQTRKNWKGQTVWVDAYEERHPQEFVRGVPDRQTVRDPRPEPDPVFLDSNDVTQDDL